MYIVTECINTRVHTVKTFNERDDAKHYVNTVADELVRQVKHKTGYSAVRQSYLFTVQHDSLIPNNPTVYSIEMHRVNHEITIDGRRMFM